MQILGFFGVYTEFSICSYLKMWMMSFCRWLFVSLLKLFIKTKKTKKQYVYKTYFTFPKTPHPPSMYSSLARYITCSVFSEPLPSTVQSFSSQPPKTEQLSDVCHQDCAAETPGAHPGAPWHGQDRHLRLHCLPPCQDIWTSVSTSVLQW